VWREESSSIGVVGNISFLFLFFQKSQVHCRVLTEHLQEGLALGQHLQAMALLQVWRNESSIIGFVGDISFLLLFSGNTKRIVIVNFF
jgi:hypothetical protein